MVSFSSTLGAATNAGVSSVRVSSVGVSVGGVSPASSRADERIAAASPGRTDPRSGPPPPSSLEFRCFGAAFNNALNPSCPSFAVPTAKFPTSLPPAIRGLATNLSAFATTSLTFA